MKLKLICYLKSGAVVSDELEFIESALRVTAPRAYAGVLRRLRDI